jgi:hypothetical protein
MHSCRWLPLVSLLCLLLPARGQDIPPRSDQDKKAPALKVHDVTGPNKGKELDYTAERKNKATVYAFVQADKWDRPMARFLRKLDEVVQKQGKETLVVAVWLTDDPDKTGEYLPRAQQSLQFQTTALAYFRGEKSGPNGWGINADSHLTVVVVNQGKLAATFDYLSVNETDVPAVHEALKKATRGK